MDTKQKHVSQWYGITHCKCPRCRIGDVFTGATYSLKTKKMNEFCPHCALKFEREPGYFYVSMFVSYALNVAEMISISILAYMGGLKLEYENLWYFIILLSLASLLLSPFNYRYSRMILLYWLSPGLHYEPNRGKKS